MEIFNPKFQYYEGDIRYSFPIGRISLYDFVSVHQNPKPKTREMIDHIATLSGKDKNEAKRHLHYFTPAVCVKDNYARRYANITNFTGLAQLDFDKLDCDPIELRDHLFSTYPEVVCAYLSPSKKGVKGLLRIPVCTSTDEFKDYYHGFLKEIEGLDGIDLAPQNAVLPLYISYDETMLFRDDAIEWTVKADRTVEYVNLIDPQAEVRVARFTNSYYEKITRQIFEKKLANIDGDGHPQLRSACLILGSRCAAGYIDQTNAEIIAEQAVLNSTYYSKGVAGYLKTAYWAMNEGMKNPKEYK